MPHLRSKDKEQHASELLSEKLMVQNVQLKKENEKLKKAHKELKTLFERIDEVLSVDMVSYKLVQMSAACEKNIRRSMTDQVLGCLIAKKS